MIHGKNNLAATATLLFLPTFLSEQRLSLHSKHCCCCFRKCGHFFFVRERMLPFTGPFQAAVGGDEQPPVRHTPRNEKPREGV